MKPILFVPAINRQEVYADQGYCRFMWKRTAGLGNCGRAASGRECEFRKLAGSGHLWNEPSPQRAARGQLHQWALSVQKRPSTNGRFPALRRA